MYQSRLLPVFILTLYATTTATEILKDLVSKTVCYNEYGCFTTAPPWGLTLQRPIAVLPESPEIINTHFLLYTRQSASKAQLIDRHTTLGTWDRSKSTKILVHGFLDSVNSTWWPKMKDAFLAAEDCNVIFTDWNPANYFPYTQATANAQVVGAEIALLVNKMIKTHGAVAADFHIIAHSLGAAVAGYAGQRINGLGRITGLDPASPFFANADPIVRLDSTDAKFVDIIHTDGTSNLLLGFGTLEQLGHVDFYPNGGINQPSCPTASGKLIDSILTLGPMDIIGPMDIQGFFNTTLCSHFAAVHMFTNSILDRCVYRGFSCKSYADFQQGQCVLHRNEGNFMGYRASPNKALGQLYLNTQTSDHAPFCIHHYQISLVSDSSHLQTKAQVKLTLIGSQATQSILFDSEDTVFKRNGVETRYIPLTVNLGTIQNINIAFERTSHWIASPLYSSKWTFKQVTIIDADRQTSMTLCPANNGMELESGSNANFSPCFN